MARNSSKANKAARSNAFSIDEIVSAVMAHEKPGISWRNEAKELNGAAKANRMKAYAAFMHRVAVIGLDVWHRGMSGEIKAALVAGGATKAIAKVISETGQGVLAVNDDILAAAVAGEAELLAEFEAREIKTESALRALWKAPEADEIKLARAYIKLDPVQRAAFAAAVKAMEEEAALADARAADAAALATGDDIAAE